MRQPTKTPSRTCESLSKGRRKQGCKREYRVSRDTKKARESSVVRDSRLHPPLKGALGVAPLFWSFSRSEREKDR